MTLRVICYIQKNKNRPKREILTFIKKKRKGKYIQNKQAKNHCMSTTIVPNRTHSCRQTALSEISNRIVRKISLRIIWHDSLFFFQYRVYKCCSVYRTVWSEDNVSTTGKAVIITFPCTPYAHRTKITFLFYGIFTLHTHLCGPFLTNNIFYYLTDHRPSEISLWKTIC